MIESPSPLISPYLLMLPSSSLIISAITRCILVASMMVTSPSQSVSPLIWDIAVIGIEAINAMIPISITDMIRLIIVFFLSQIVGICCSHLYCNTIKLLCKPAICTSFLWVFRHIEQLPDDFSVTPDFFRQIILPYSAIICCRENKKKGITQTIYFYQRILLKK